MIVGKYLKYRLRFRFTARTSREVMRYKDTYLAKVYDTEDEGRMGYGECALFKGLSAEDLPDYEEQLARRCADPLTPTGYSSIDCGFEMALAAMTYRAETAFERGEASIPINGLIWMGSKEEMTARIEEKLEQGYRVLKLKIGGIDLASEMELLGQIRRRYSPADLELRLDANGSLDRLSTAAPRVGLHPYGQLTAARCAAAARRCAPRSSRPDEVLEQLKRLSEYSIHSIEQPIRAGQTEAMARVCRQSPIPIALDEELIGSRSEAEGARLLDQIQPQYIILKPSLCGGFLAAQRYIEYARAHNIGWWVTSALESNIGLRAVAIFAARQMRGSDWEMPQGLGTGQLYTNNIGKPLRLNAGGLWVK